MSAYNQFYNITEDSAPEPEEFNNEYPVVEQCDCCYEYSESFVNHKGFTICEECINNQEGESLDQIVENIQKYSTKDKSMMETMNNINSLCYKVLHPYD